jgi:hypothetical protein
MISKREFRLFLKLFYGVSSSEYEVIVQPISQSFWDVDAEHQLAELPPEAVAMGRPFDFEVYYGNQTVQIASPTFDGAPIETVQLGQDMSTRYWFTSAHAVANREAGISFAGYRALCYALAPPVQ